MASLGATRSAMDLQQLDGLQSVLGMVKEQLEDGAGGGNPAAWDDEAPEEGYKALSATDLEVQRRIFDQFDVDNTGQLAQVETMRMLKACIRTEELSRQRKRQRKKNFLFSFLSSSFPSHRGLPYVRVSIRRRLE